MTTEETRVVLVVDDDESYRSSLQRALGRRGFQVRTAGSVAEASQLLLQVRVDFASIDLRMPGESGLTLVQHLKEQQPHAVIVVMTGYGSIATALTAVRLGATHYLTKPADASDLLAAFGALPGPLVTGSSLVAGSAPSAPLEVPSLARVEWEHLNRVVADCGGNISQAARLLRMQRRSLQRKLAKYPVAK
jgi:two-component system, response regulator RegA